MQVKVSGEVATGTGPNKKVAKRNAAEAMLLLLGYKASTCPQSPTEVTLPHTRCLTHDAVFCIPELLDPGMGCLCVRRRICTGMKMYWERSTP